MSAVMNELLKLNFLFQKHLHLVNQLPLSKWVAVAEKLGVAPNDRAHAAKKLAIREMQASA